MIAHFQRFRELPRIARHRAEEEDISWDLGHYEGRFDDLARIDNTFQDYDPRPNHVLVNQDLCTDSPMAAEYHGTIERGKIKIVLLGGEQCNEDYFFADGQTVDILHARCYENGQRWEFEARHVDRFSSNKNTEQSDKIQDSRTQSIVQRA